MAMRVIAGKAKGRTLTAPDGFTTRPITDQIKSALFSSWQFKLQDASFLDLFAGSGAMGIEAISRGASKVVFVEKWNVAINVIKNNLKVCKFDDGYKIMFSDVFDALKKLSNNGEKFNIIYADPPFTVPEIFLPVLQAVSDARLLDENGLFAIRSHIDLALPDEIGNLVKEKVKKYGISNVHIYREKTE